MPVIEKSVSLAKPLIKGLDWLSSVLDLVIRFWVAKVFFTSGLTKLMSWDTTIALFTNEYDVPLLPPEVAAPMAAFTELTFPVLLVLGFGARLSSVVLFVFNIIAATSYPDLSEVGLKDHIYWGLLLLVPLLHGPGKISIDYFISKKYMGQNITARM